MWAVRRMSVGFGKSPTKPTKPKKKKSKAGNGRRRSSGRKAGSKGGRKRSSGGKTNGAARGRNGRRPSLDDAYAAAIRPYSKATAPHADLWDGLKAYATEQKLKVALKDDSMQLGMSFRGNGQRYVDAGAPDPGAFLSGGGGDGALGEDVNIFAMCTVTPELSRVAIHVSYRTNVTDLIRPVPARSLICALLTAQRRTPTTPPTLT